MCRWCIRRAALPRRSGLHYGRGVPQITGRSSIEAAYRASEVMRGRRQVREHRGFAKRAFAKAQWFKEKKQ